MERARSVCPAIEWYASASAALGHSSLCMGEGTLAGRSLAVLAQDARTEGGSFGRNECDVVAQWLVERCGPERPLILLLDSGGARMSEGLRALAGFARLYRALADAWLRGTPMLAICGRTVFGGASMLATVVDTRRFFEQSLFGMSGPRIVQAVAGQTDFDARDPELVTQTMGGGARAAREGTTILEDSVRAVHAACVAWVERSCAVGTQNGFSAMPVLVARLIEQRQQLARDHLERPPDPAQVISSQIPISNIRNAWVDHGVLLGRLHDGSYLYGLVNGVWADSWQAWTLANAILCQIQTHPECPIHIVLDCPAHATNRALESGMMSQYFSLLGLVVRQAHRMSGHVTLHISGEAAGGVYVALAGGASRTIGYPGANIRILPQIALSQVRAGSTQVDSMHASSRHADDYRVSGVVDDVVTD